MKKYISKNFLFFALSMNIMANVAYAGSGFAVVGEQLDYPIPQGWKLAWMTGEPNGAFNAEYVPSDEDIKSWRKGYLLIRRVPYPVGEQMAQLRLHKVRLNEFALALYMEKASSSCPGKHQAMTSRINAFNGIPFAVSGGFCDRYGAIAPHGEGAFVALAEGKEFLFQIQYGWRPDSAQAAESNLPWRIGGDEAIRYLNSLKEMTLCGGQQQAECKVSYLPQN